MIKTCIVSTDGSLVQPSEEAIKKVLTYIAEHRCAAPSDVLGLHFRRRGLRHILFDGRRCSYCRTRTVIVDCVLRKRPVKNALDLGRTDRITNLYAFCPECHDCTVFSIFIPVDLDIN